MDLMQQLIADNKRRKAQLEEELATAESVVAAVRKKLRHVVKHGKSLEADYGNGEATLPLSPPDDEEEEEATDEADDADAMHAAHPVVGAEPLVPDEWSPDYEVPSELAEAGVSVEEYQQARAAADVAEPEKPIRRRKAKATAEE